MTDPLRIVATGLCTVATAELTAFVLAYHAREGLDGIVVGEPLTLRGEPSESQRWLRPAIARLRKVLPPEVSLDFYDERFTSAMAHQAMLDGGLGRMARRNKALVDEISATIILNDYLQSKQYQQ